MAFGVPLSACEPPRPSGAYIETSLDSGSGQQGRGDAASSVDADIPTGGGTGGTTGTTGTATTTGGTTGPTTDGAVATPADPRDAVVGDYLLRFDNRVVGNNSLVGDITTDTLTYGVMRLTADGATGLLATEWLCYSEINQRAPRGQVETVVPGEDPWRQIVEVKRMLTIDTASGTWSTDRGTRRQGWDGDGGIDEMPRQIDGNRDRLLDPNKDGILGMTSQVTVDPLIGSGLSCTYGLVSTTITSYEGTLKDGLPASGQVQLHGTKVYAISGSSGCSVSRVNDADLPEVDIDTVRMARVASQWLDGSGKVCPPRPEFQAALP